jgi:hypothetical protein
VPTGGNARKHGHSSHAGVPQRTPTYYSWQNMLARCRYPSVAAYRWYGGRGIKVCERWAKFENFLADMGERPEGTQIGRKDNDGDYEPGNCEWTTRRQNIAERHSRVPVSAVSLANLIPGGSRR